MLSYNKQTTNSPNPFARFAHRNRIKQSVDLAINICNKKKILDYGCGSGFFIKALLDRNYNNIMGYEPYRAEECQDNLPISNDLKKILEKAPYDLVTMFETVEHLTESDFRKFLNICETKLKPKDGILFSAPIEIGPALLLKELNRSLLRFRKMDNSIWELFMAALFGKAAKPAKSNLNSHKGFDFRKTIKLIKLLGWSVEIISYGPLPIKSWYGNSQVYFRATKID